MSSILKKIKSLFTNKEKRMIYLAQMGFYNHMSDEEFLKKQFKNVFGYELDLNNPKTYNEKLQWLKLYDRKRDFTKYVDKYEVKKYASKILGNEYIIPTLGVWNNFDDIDFSKLPQKFVLKCTHDSGGIVVCENKDNLNLKKAKHKINKCLKKNYYIQNRESPYKNVNRRIIAEIFLVDESGYELKDYKFFCFNGVVKYLYVASNRNSSSETCFDFYDKEFNHLDIINGHPNSKNKISKPQNFDKMIELAEKISKNFLHIRVDFYNVNGKIFFGEMTFYHMSGFTKFEPKEWDYKFGDLLKLPKK